MLGGAPLVAYFAALAFGLGDSVFNTQVQNFEVLVCSSPLMLTLWSLPQCYVTAMLGLEPFVLPLLCRPSLSGHMPSQHGHCLYLDSVPFLVCSSGVYPIFRPAFTLPSFYVPPLSCLEY